MRSTARQHRGGRRRHRVRPQPAGAGRAARGARRGALHVRRRDRGAAAHQIAAFAASARQDRLRSTRRPRWPFPACMRCSRTRTPRARCSRPRGTNGPGWTRTIPACSTTWCASSARKSRRWSRRPRRPRRKAAAVSRSITKSCPPCSIPRQAIAPGAPVLHGDKAPEHRVIARRAQHRCGNPW